MSGTIPPLPNTPSCRSAQLKLNSVTEDKLSKYKSLILRKIKKGYSQYKFS